MSPESTWHLVGAQCIFEEGGEGGNRETQLTYVTGRTLLQGAEPDPARQALGHGAGTTEANVISSCLPTVAAPVSQRPRAPGPRPSLMPLLGAALSQMSPSASPGLSSLTCKMGPTLPPVQVIGRVNSGRV